MLILCIMSLIGIICYRINKLGEKEGATIVALMSLILLGACSIAAVLMDMYFITAQLFVCMLSTLFIILAINNASFYTARSVLSNILNDIRKG